MIGAILIRQHCKLADTPTLYRIAINVCFKNTIHMLDILYVVKELNY